METMEMAALDAYLNRVYKIIVLLIPTYCVCAAASITFMQASGWYPPIDHTLLALFDASTLVYLAIGIYFIRTGFGADGIVRPDKLRAAKITMAVIIVIQWNAISYLWPFTDFWAYFLLFTIVEAFFFDPKLVAWTSTAIVLSLTVSWFLGSEMLLPARDELFAMNLMFRVVGLVLMMLSVNVITYLGGKFLVEELEKHANYDTLTHLLNRRSLGSHLQAAHALADAGKTTFCLLLLDIDDFKQVNDTYGYDCGDEVLKQIARVISTSVKKDDLVFRWGGEEILVLLNVDEERAVEVAEAHPPRDRGREGALPGRNGGGGDRDHRPRPLPGGRVGPEHDGRRRRETLLRQEPGRSRPAAGGEGTAVTGRRSILREAPAPRQAAGAQTPGDQGGRGRKSGHKEKGTEAIPSPFFFCLPIRKSPPGLSLRARHASGMSRPSRRGAWSLPR